MSDVQDMMVIECWVETDTGPTRDNNEDAYVWLLPEQTGGDAHVFVVADGMGGAAAGEVASQFVVDTVADRFAATLRDCPEPRVAVGE